MDNQVADHSYLSTFPFCNRKHYYANEIGLKRKGEENIPMIFGSAGHKAMEVLYGPGGFNAVDDAIDAAHAYIDRSGVLLPPGIKKWEHFTPGHLTVILRNYVDRWKGDEFKVTARVEEPLISEVEQLGGIPDLIVEDDLGPLVMDHKFTGSRLGEGTMNRVKFSKQGLIYCVLASEHYGMDIRRVVFNHIHMGPAASSDAKKSRATLFKRDRFPEINTDAVGSSRSYGEFSDADLDETRAWVRQTKKLIEFNRFCQLTHVPDPPENSWPQNGGQHCSYMCSFDELCGSDPAKRAEIIEAKYEVSRPEGQLLSGADVDD